MTKNILIFADGTGNEGGLLPDESKTNVYKLYRATRCGPDSTIDPAKQLAFYIPGIGTPTPRHDSRWNRLKETVQQGLGFGITKKVIDCYVAILGVWRPGDRIYLFGFSRGAYTARCVAHVIEVCGIPTQEKDGSPLNLDPKSLRGVAQAAAACLYIGGMPRPAESANKRIAEFRKVYAPVLGLASGASTYLIGVWDTVAAIGWQRFFPDWTYDRHFCHEIQYARHLQSIDECRQDFKRVGWGGSGTVTWPDRKDEPEQFDQIWFAGNHADIGGSYPENESRLSDITLDWMVRFISEKIREEGRVLVNHEVLRLYPTCEGMMHDECMVGIGGSSLHWNKMPREVPVTAQLHQSVYDRLALPAVRNFSSYAPYRPSALQNHDKAKAFYRRHIENASAQTPSVDAS